MCATALASGRSIVRRSPQGSAVPEQPTAWAGVWQRGGPDDTGRTFLHRTGPHLFGARPRRGQSGADGVDEHRFPGELGREP
jgi:hypothetical protein